MLIVEPKQKQSQMLSTLKDFFLHRLALAYITASLAGSAFLGFYVEIVTYYHVIVDGFRVPFETLPYLGQTVALASVLASLILGGLGMFVRWGLGDMIRNKADQPGLVVKLWAAYGLTVFFAAMLPPFLGLETAKNNFYNDNPYLTPVLNFSWSSINVLVVSGLVLTSAVKKDVISRSTGNIIFVAVIYFGLLYVLSLKEVNNAYLKFIGYGGNMQTKVYYLDKDEPKPIFLRLRTEQVLLAYEHKVPKERVLTKFVNEGVIREVLAHQPRIEDQMGRRVELPVSQIQYMGY